MGGRREKKNRVIHQSQAEDPLFDDTGYYDQIPSVISAPTDAVSQQEMLRTSSNRFKKRSNSRVGDSVEDNVRPLSATQQAFLESDENYHHHYSSPSRSSRPGLAQASYADDYTTDDASTLPTFVSVGESIDLQKCCSKVQQQQRSDTNTFLVSKEVYGSDEQQPTLLKLVSFEPTSSKSSSDDHDTRKRLHYKEKLHSLTHRFMTSSAVGRSKEMISDIFDIAGSTTITTNAVVAPPRREDHRDTTTNKKNDAKNKKTVCINPSDTCQFVKFSSSPASPVREESTHSSSLDSLEHLISKIGQAFSACSSMCTCLDLDDTTVNHEGLVINIPKKKKKKKKGYEDCMCAGDILHSNNERSSCSSTSGDSTNEEECCWTDMSSLTGPTTYRYQRRYWLDDVPKDEVQWR